MTHDQAFTNPELEQLHRKYAHTETAAETAAETIDPEREPDPGFVEIVTAGTAVAVNIWAARARVIPDPVLVEKFGAALAAGLAFEGIGLTVDPRWQIWGRVAFLGYNLVGSAVPMPRQEPPAEEANDTGEDAPPAEPGAPLGGVAVGDVYRKADGE